MSNISPGNLYLFKYGIIDSKWQEKITHQCRGVIMRHDAGEWRCMSRPFDKVFNQHEGYCEVFSEEEFNKRVHTLHVAEKADGSCIQLWHDDDVWRVSTLGMINTSLVQECDLTFEQLFWGTVSIKKEKLDKSLTYIFELCCDENRIVTRYGTNHAVLLAARSRETGAYVKNLDYILVNCLNVRLAEKDSCKRLGLKSLEDVQNYVEQESQNESKYGEYPEGFVLYDSSGAPIAKMKNKRYVSLHRVGGGDIKHSKNVIVDAIFLGHIDDLYDVLSDRLKAFADNMKDQASAMIADAREMVTKLSSQDYEDRKEFALAVQQNVRKEFASFFFKNIDHFVSTEEDPNIMEEFDKWLKASYKKFNWKD
jgi:T4 RnlA family RNA ligase